MITSIVLVLFLSSITVGLFAEHKRLPQQTMQVNVDIFTDKNFPL